jgi:hypothetical protein
MSTKNYYIYDIIEALRQFSDDTNVSIEHLSFLIDNNRALLLRQKYKDIGQIIPQGIRQRLHFPLELVDDNVFASLNKVLATTTALPRLIESGDYMRALYLDGGNYKDMRFIYVQPERFQYCGNNFDVANVIYVTLNQDYKLNLKALNPSHKLVENIRIWGVFENPKDAWEVSADYDATKDFDTEIYYPIDSDMWVTMKEMILKQIIGSMKIPEDKINSAENEV